MRSWFSSTRFLLALAVALLGVPAASWAVPVTYNFTTGTVDITASKGAADIGTGGIDLDGDFATFDPGPTPDLSDFDFTATAQGPLMLTTPYAGYDTITIDSLLIEPGAGYTTIFGFGSNPYTVTVGPLDVSGIATITDSNAILPDQNMLPFGFTTASLTATITLNAMNEFELTGVTLGEIGPFGTETEALTLKGDITFVGLPEPGTLMLLGVGLLGLARAGRPRRS